MAQATPLTIASTLALAIKRQPLLPHSRMFRQRLHLANVIGAAHHWI
jgi:hypothetical protein